MFINRDNYETIFLLYVDNELSAQERNAVEEFVEANPDLGEELEVLFSTVLPKEDAVFVPKTQLYRNATPVESVQESLLLMLDNELADDYKSGLVKQINESKEVKEEWAILQRTLLDKNDVVVFPDKKMLYRHTTRVVPMKVWRVAAAVLIGIGIFSGLTLYNSNKVNDGVSVAKEITKQPASIASENKNEQVIAKPNENLAEQEQIASPQNNLATTVKSATTERKQSATENVVQVQKVTDKNLTPQGLPENMLAKEENMVEKKTVQPDRNEDAIVVTESPIKAEINNSLVNDSDVGKLKNTFARLAVNEEDPDRFLNIEEDKVTRSKLGGIIRQVKRVVERNTKIKTSNGLRIGGFEIAIK